MRVLAVFVTALGMAQLQTGCAHTSKALTSRGGTLELRNGTREKVEVFVQGTRLTVLEPGEGLTADRLPLGRVKVQVKGTRSGELQEDLFVLARGKTERWTIDETRAEKSKLDRLFRGRLRVRNLSGEPVRLFLDGRERQMLWPDAEAKWTKLELGLHVVKAVGSRSGTVVAEQVRLDDHSVPTVVVKIPRADLAITNQSGFDCVVMVSHLPPLTVGDGDTKTLEGVPPGKVVMKVLDMRQHPIASLQVEAVPGKVTAVRIPRPAGVLAVVSNLKQDVAILVDGVKLGSCAASGATQIEGLPFGVVRVEAMSDDGTILARAKVVIPEKGKGVAILNRGSARDEEGSILVKNGTNEPVLVRVDGYDRGRVKPQGERLILRVFGRKHLVQVLGARSGHTWSGEVEVQPGGRGVFEVLPPVCRLAVANHRDERVQLVVDGQRVKVVLPSSSASIPIPCGAHYVEARGLRTYASTSYSVSVLDSAEYPLELYAPLSRVAVTNRFQDPVVLEVNDREVGLLNPGDQVTLDDMRPGRVTLRARSTERPISWSTTVNLDAGQGFSWEVGTQ